MPPSFCARLEAYTAIAVMAARIGIIKHVRMQTPVGLCITPQATHEKKVLQKLHFLITG